MKDMTFKAEKDGKTTEYNIITYVKNPKNNKNYILYSEPNSEKVYASVYNIIDGELILDDIKTDEEWDFLDEVLEKLEDKNV